ncbi:MAG: hypothetical protein M1538_00140 [Candidatus Marsarchaeota archaeon]|jgi:hypothetical protein|nr:hypothetical protein [Candidatus Marsarchaeota archaeon]
MLGKIIGILLVFAVIIGILLLASPNLVLNFIHPIIYQKPPTLQASSNYINITKTPHPNITTFYSFTNDTTNQQARLVATDSISFSGTSYNLILYNGYYIQTYVGLSALVYKNSTYTNVMNYLVGKKVYLDYALANDRIVSAPYIVKSVKVIGSRVYYNFTQDTGLNEKPVNPSNQNFTLAMRENTSTQFIGFYYNKTEIIIPLS